jgi:Flp pilus assembly protein TadD
VRLREGSVTAQGIALLENAFAAAPDSIGIGADLAEAYLVTGRAIDARQTIHAALDRRPDDRRLLRLKAIAEENAGVD